jgi:hypothetical protein
MISEHRYRWIRPKPDWPHILFGLTLNATVERLLRGQGVFQAILHARMPRSS